MGMRSDEKGEPRSPMKRFHCNWCGAEAVLEGPYRGKDEWRAKYSDSECISIWGFKASDYFCSNACRDEKEKLDSRPRE